MDDFQKQYATPGKFKTQLDDIVKAMTSSGGSSLEREPHAAEAPRGKQELVQEVLTEPELEKKPELSGYIEKVEKATELTTPVMDDYTNQVLLASAKPNVKIKLPLEEAQIEEGLHHKVWEAIRWLAEWCLRQLKIIKAKEVADTTEI